MTQLTNAEPLLLQLCASAGEAALARKNATSVRPDPTTHFSDAPRIPSPDTIALFSQSHGRNKPTAV
jgi:hypothetical protein